MKLWLSYSFDNESPFPLYDGSQPLSDPVAVEWNPAIYCESESENLGGYYDELPLPDVNVAEIRVESMRAYHLLCRREELQDFVGVVRILPPVPVPKPINDNRKVVVIVDDIAEYNLACAIAHHYNGSVMPTSYLNEKVIAEAGCLVFPQIKSATSALLCAGICEGCAIVASDAGASEEYLTKFAVPGAWHVVHKRKKDHFIGAVNDLYGVGDWMQLPYCDDAPYE
jgi:hypothetical protein